MFSDSADGSVDVTSLLCVPALTDGPRFIEPIPNVTVALGRDASLPCVVENLGSYKVSPCLLSLNLSVVFRQ
jgi:hypothetical protein